MANYGFSYVAGQGYLSFAKALTEGEWKAISISGFEAPPTERLPVSLLAAPKQVVWKARLLRSTDALNAVLQKNVGQAPSLVDPRWDAAQTQLRSLIVAGVKDEDPLVQAAGERLFRSLLLGESGLGQNQLVYQLEVDHAVMQLTLARGALSADVQLLGLERCINRIERVNKELSDALGRAPGQTSQLASDRNELLRQTLVATNETFNAVLSDIDWYLENITTEDIEPLRALREPLQALLDRYSPPRAARTSEPNPQPTTNPDAKP
jgi:hypothetical protein